LLCEGLLEAGTAAVSVGEENRPFGGREAREGGGREVRLMLKVSVNPVPMEVCRIYTPQTHTRTHLTPTQHPEAYPTRGRLGQRRKVGGS